MSRRTTDVARVLPTWFEWRDYQRLSNLQNNAEWAWLFASRDPGVENEMKRGLGVLRVLNFHRQQTRLAWRNGVLCYGMKGHATNEYLMNLVRQASERESTGFVSEDRFRTFQTKGQLRKHGSHFRSVPGGYLAFASERSLHAYEEVEKAAFARTTEFAVNLQMPKAFLLKEIEDIIDEQQKRFAVQKMPKKVPRANARIWSRGLAVVDLLSDGLLQADIARLLVPRWFGRHPEPKASDGYKKEVRIALQTVKPYIDGGWRTLCGDPVVSARSPLIPPA